MGFEMVESGCADTRLELRIQLCFTFRTFATIGAFGYVLAIPWSCLKSNSRFRDMLGLAIVLMIYEPFPHTVRSCLSSWPCLIVSSNYCSRFILISAVLTPMFILSLVHIAAWCRAAFVVSAVRGFQAQDRVDTATVSYTTLHATSAHSASMNTVTRV